MFKEQNYAQSAQVKVENKRFESCEFWKILNKILNKGKMSVPAIINDPEVTTFSYDKVRLITMNFDPNFTLDNKDHPLPDFPLLMEHKL